MNFRFSHRLYRRPLRVPLRTAHGLWAEREGVIVRLEDEHARVGYGEAAPIPWLGSESVVDVVAMCERLGSDVSTNELGALPVELGCLRFALAQASEEIGPVSASIRLPVAALLPAGRAVLPILLEKNERGFLAFKWKVGVGSADDELGLLDDVLAALPTHAKLRLDANGAWDRRTAIRWLERCADRPIEFIEQPVAPTDRDALLGLARDYPVKLALDESVVRLTQAREWQGAGWNGVFVIKPALTGPLSELVDWVQSTKPDVVLSSAIESSLARAAILRLALSAGLTKRALGFGTGGLFGDRLWDGSELGPLADASAIDINSGEAIWNALS